MKEALILILVGLGTGFMLIAALGIVRLPDLYTRMHAATKAGTLGVSGIILGLAVHFDNLAVTMRALLVIGFLYLTAPIAAHVIGRAAYFGGVPFWEGNVIDELKESAGQSETAQAGNSSHFQGEPPAAPLSDPD